MPNILIVDDNPDISFMIKEKLRFFIGGDLRIAHNSDDCLAAVRVELPDLILLDICMPGTDGYEVCRLLKEDPRTAAVPVIFLSATYNDLRSRIKGLDLGADDFMVQPVDDLELVTRVKAVLQIKALRDQVRDLRDSLGQAQDRHDNLRQRLMFCCGKVMTACRTGLIADSAAKELSEEVLASLEFIKAGEQTEGEGTRSARP